MPTFIARTIGDVVAEMLMTRSAFGGSLLVLEGDDDAKFWNARIMGKVACQVVLAGSKRTAIGAVVKMYGLMQTGIIAIVDDDYDSLLERPLPLSHIVRTETCDIEALMLRSTALEKMIYELGDDTKISIIEQAEGRTIREVIASRALVFGQLRYLNALNNWNVSFEKMSPYRFADVATWRFNEEMILEETLRQVPGLSMEDLESQLVSIRDREPWSLLHGKDSLSVIAVGLRSAIGNSQHPIERLSQMLRLAFDHTIFQGTVLYSNVRAWEANNVPFKILSDSLLTS